jgi:N-formylglutamate deformylase
MIEFESGTTPLVISLPHVGRELPAEIAARMTPVGRAVADTDWHVEQLYGFARGAGAAWLQPRLSRYVVDLNRPPTDTPLYPGQVSTGLCPAQSFAGEDLYVGGAPDAADVERRRGLYFQPYHARLQALLDEAIGRHGYAVLLDAHSIQGEVPRLFEGRLPDVNVGTNDGRACAPALAAAIMAELGAQSRFSSVLNGRFKGGYITRHYGAPERRVHAVQFELVQAAYMDEVSTHYDPARAAPLQEVLRGLVRLLMTFRPS